MTQKAPYQPDTDKGKAQWLNTFSVKLSQPWSGGGTLGAYVGLTPAEIASLSADSLMFLYAISQLDAFTKAKTDRTQYKNVLRDGPIGTPLGAYPVFTPVTPPTAVAAGIFIRVSVIVARIKTSPNYNEGIGHELGIIGAEQSFNPDDLTPDIKIKIVSHGVKVIWKKGLADAINIYVDRSDGQGFRFLATDTEPDYIDTFPIPEGATSVVWKYKAIYVISDEEVGQWSDEAKATITRQVG